MQLSTLQLQTLQEVMSICTALCPFVYAAFRVQVCMNVVTTETTGSVCYQVFICLGPTCMLCYGCPILSHWWCDWTFCITEFLQFTFHLYDMLLHQVAPKLPCVAARKFSYRFNPQSPSHAPSVGVGEGPHENHSCSTVGMHCDFHGMKLSLSFHGIEPPQLCTMISREWKIYIHFVETTAHSFEEATN